MFYPSSKSVQYVHSADGVKDPHRDFSGNQQMGVY